jgi:hypothetical protein
VSTGSPRRRRRRRRGLPGAFGQLVAFPNVAVASLARKQPTIRRPRATPAANAPAVAPSADAIAEAVVLAARAVSAVDEVAFVASTRSTVGRRVAAGPRLRVAALLVGAHAGGIVVGRAALAVEGSERLDDRDQVSYSLSFSSPFSLGVKE